MSVLWRVIFNSCRLIWRSSILYWRLLCMLSSDFISHSLFGRGSRFSVRLQGLMPNGLCFADSWPIPGGIMSSDMRMLYREFLNLLAKKRGEILGTVPGSSPWDLGRSGGDPSIDVDRSYLFVTRDYEANESCIRREELLSIQKAIHRMKNGIYGVCSTCNKRIEIEHLRHLPEENHCASCKKIQLGL